MPAPGLLYVKMLKNVILTTQEVGASHAQTRFKPDQMLYFVQHDTRLKTRGRYFRSLSPQCRSSVFRLGRASNTPSVDLNKSIREASFISLLS